MGYPSAATAPAIQFGFAIPLQTMFIVDEAMNVIQEIAIPRVQQILCILDNLVFGKIVESQDYLAALRMGDMTLREAKRGETHPDLLRRELRFYVGLLCDTLGAPRYFFSERFRSTGGVGNGSVRR
jgi:hypothetical protein